MPVLVYYTDYIRWINPAMQPSVHYGPFKKDLSDLYTVFQWLKTHDDQVQQIVHNANALMDDAMKEEDILDDLAFYLNDYASICHWNSSGSI